MDHDRAHLEGRSDLHRDLIGRAGGDRSPWSPIVPTRVATRRGAMSPMRRWMSTAVAGWAAAWLLVVAGTSGARGQERPSICRAEGRRIPPAEWMAIEARRAAHPAVRPAAEHRPPGGQSPRPRRHRRLQRPRTLAHRPGPEEGDRSPGGPPELVRPGRIARGRSDLVVGGRGELAARVSACGAIA